MSSSNAREPGTYQQMKPHEPRRKNGPLSLRRSLELMIRAAEFGVFK
jgi:hypothetical protein